MSAPGRPVPYAPHGAVDGFVCDTNFAKKMIICGRYGSSCGTPFIKDEYIKEHRQYEIFSPFLLDRPTQEWTIFKNNFTVKKKGKNNKTKKRYYK
jgi:hypothetical protein